MEYSKEYFIKKFEAIPEDKWISSMLTAPNRPDCHCALGHCGVEDLRRLTPEAKALSVLLRPIHEKTFGYSGSGASACVVYDINDGMINLGEHPKERILTALNMVEV